MPTQYASLADDILDGVGGSENVASLYHCATRLRFTLHVDSKADLAALEIPKEVISVVQAGGQTQIVIGPEVANVYNAIQTEMNGSGAAATTPAAENAPPVKKENFLNRMFTLFSAIFTPFVPVLAGAGILRGLVTLLVSVGWLDAKSGTYTILWAASDVVLYFLPFFLAITTARHFKVNEFIALALAGTMLYPSILDAFTNQTPLDFLGIDVVLIKYSASVVPIIIAVFVLAKLDGLIRPLMPSLIRSFATPLIDLLIMVPLTLLAIGPVFTWVTTGFTSGFLAVYAFSPILMGLILGAIWHPLVIFGLHRGFIPVNLNNLATLGRDPLIAITMPSNFAQTGAALGVALRSKNKRFKALAGSTVVSGLFGVTEPIVYGVTLKVRRAFFFSCVMAAVGGAIIAGGGVYAIGLPSGGLLATPVFANAIIWYLVAISVAFVGSFLLTVIFGFKDVPADYLSGSDADPDTDPKAAGTTTASSETGRRLRRKTKSEAAA